MIGLSARSVQASTERAFRLPPLSIPIGVGLLIGALLAAISFGTSDIAFSAIVAELVDAVPGIRVESGLTDSQRSILWQWRLPRAVLGALVGSSLALGGATYQGVFRNPLADPYLLGVAAGAGLGATIAIVSGADQGWGPIHPVPIAAFVGGMIAIGASAGVGFGVSRSPGSLLLAGVAVASFLTAVQTYVMQRNTDILVEVYTWILGRLGTFGWTEVIILAPYVAVCSAVILMLRRQLDVMQLGDDEAVALGVPVVRVRILLVVAASLLAAAAVAVSGLIAFVGIIVPHFVRLTVGSNYRTVLPLSAIGGATFLVLADIGARNLTSGAELPIGVVTAFFGAPFFACVMW
ncbi:MAG: FecCD family ABC transporter permease, partial [Acidimicrobiales bacterium]